MHRELRRGGVTPEPLVESHSAPQQLCFRASLTTSAAEKSLAAVYTAGRKANLLPQNLQTSPKCEADGAAGLMRAGPTVL